MTNLQRLQILTEQLEVEENEFVDYVVKANYAILLVSEAGRIKWCNDCFYKIFGLDRETVDRKGMKRILGCDILNYESSKIKLKTSENKEIEFIIKKSSLERNGKLIHKKIALIPNE